MYTALLNTEITVPASFLMYINVKKIIVLEEIYNDKNILSLSEEKTNKHSRSCAAKCRKCQNGESEQLELSDQQVYCVYIYIYIYIYI